MRKPERGVRPRRNRGRAAILVRLARRVGFDFFALYLEANPVMLTALTNRKIMSRPVTLFTGQWADLPLEQLAPLALEMGYDGLELACWGDHFDVDAAASSKAYVKEKWELLA